MAKKKVSKKLPRTKTQRAPKARAVARAKRPAPATKKPGPAPGKTATKKAPLSALDPLVGKRAPKLALMDHGGALVSSDSLRGKPYVLYFYPKDDTPGCTREACEFRDAAPDFRRAGVRVLGVSPDLAPSHVRFREKYSLPFPLLSDADKTLARAYSVWVKKKNYGREYLGILRSTFLVDAEGVVRRAWRGVKVDGHAEKVMTAVRELRSAG